MYMYTFSSEFLFLRKDGEWATAIYLQLFLALLTFITRDALKYKGFFSGQRSKR